MSVSLQGYYPSNKPGVEPRRPCRPVNITPWLHLSNVTNRVTVTWGNFGKVRIWCWISYFGVAQGHGGKQGSTDVFRSANLCISSWQFHGAPLQAGTCSSLSVSCVPLSCACYKLQRAKSWTTLISFLTVVSTVLIQIRSWKADENTISPVGTLCFRALV